MNAMYLIYVPVAAFFVAFVVYGGLVMPAREILDSLRDHRGDHEAGRKAAA
ncbi:hypothetical protein ACSNOI_25930 [Actinomadura kijaniata]|uniref:hypothetical protein n=1 Tax=Actinomadura kijaniata TaxID=46161 RepID=UPI003F1C8472